jgi:hypothetical protein
LEIKPMTHRQSNPRQGSHHRRSFCALCGGPLDHANGFVYTLRASEMAGFNEIQRDPSRVFAAVSHTVHPDCMAYQLERGDVLRGSVLTHTCGDARCVNPAHLEVR